MGPHEAPKLGALSRVAAPRVGPSRRFGTDDLPEAFGSQDALVVVDVRRTRGDGDNP